MQKNEIKLKTQNKVKATRRRIKTRRSLTQKFYEREMNEMKLKRKFYMDSLQNEYEIVGKSNTIFFVEKKTAILNFITIEIRQHKIISYISHYQHFLTKKSI